MVQRTLIRNIVKEMLQESGLQVKKIVFMRPHPMFFKELPVACVYYKDEPAEPIVGSEHLTKVYRKDLMLAVDIITHATEEAEDFLDKESKRVEFVFNKYPTIKDTSHGSKLINTKPYVVEGEAENILWGTSLSFEIPYEDEATIAFKFDTFDSYYMSINKTNDAKDPILIAGEGSFK